MYCIYYLQQNGMLDMTWIITGIIYLLVIDDCLDASKLNQMDRSFVSNKLSIQD